MKKKATSSAWNADRIRGLRERYGESQPEFIKRLGTSLATLRVWEQGRGCPSGPAEKLLDRLEEDLESRLETAEPASVAS